MPELTSPHPIGEHAPQQSDLPASPRAHALTLERETAHRLTVTGVTRIVSCDELGATLQNSTGGSDHRWARNAGQRAFGSHGGSPVHIFPARIEYCSMYPENQQSKKQSGGLLARLLR